MCSKEDVRGDFCPVDNSGEVLEQGGACPSPPDTLAVPPQEYVTSGGAGHRAPAPRVNQLLPIDSILIGNCIDIMKQFPDKSIDLTFADPPFNAMGHIGVRHGNYGPECLDNLSPGEYSSFCRLWFNEARRVSKRLLITPGTAANHLYPQPLWTVCISKPSARAFSRFGGFSCWEPLLVYDKPLSRVVRDLVIFDSMSFTNDGREQHPCPDNIKMLYWILEKWSRVDDIVLDPFVGSGTTALASRRADRHYIGIEINPRFVSLARDLLAKENAALRLPFSPKRSKS